MNGYQIVSKPLILLLQLITVSEGAKVAFVPLAHLNRDSPHVSRVFATNNPSQPQTAITDASILIPPFLSEKEGDQSSYPSVLHQIHVKSILTDDQAKEALKLARAHADSTGSWTRPDSDRHATYATCDFPIEESKELETYLEKEVGFSELIWEYLHQCYGVDKNDMSYLDFFCANYQANGSENTMDRLEEHRDGSLLSFTVTLSPPSDFEGGGTFFEALKQNDSDKSQREQKSASSLLKPNGVVRPDRAGDAVLHCGKMLHGADIVTKGSRTVLVGFVDVADHCIKPGILAAACREWGRMDVAKRRYQRQVGKTALSTNGWIPSNKKWLPKPDPSIGRGRSHIDGFCPAFLSVKRRAEDDFQRQRRLETEDFLLRNILYDSKESAGTSSATSDALPSDYTIKEDDKPEEVLLDPKFVQRNKCWVVLVDDEEAIRQSVGDFLYDEGYQVTACDGAAALLELLDQQKQQQPFQPRWPEVIVSDVRMPDMDGIELLNYLQQNPSYRQIPVVLLTAKAMAADRITGFKAGADAYLPKPFHPDELLSILDNTIVRRQQISDVNNAGNGASLVTLQQEMATIKGIMKQNSARTVRKTNVYLTPAERNVLEYVCRGYTNKEIAKERGVTLDRIIKVVQKLFKETQVKNRTELVRWAFQTGYASPQQKK